MSLPAAAILSFGAVTCLGRDPQVIAQKLGQPTGDFSPLLRVEDELLNDPATARHLRRADRFVRMASIAALDAAGRARSGVPAERVGLIVTSGLGPHGRGFKFLDGILDCGDADALPTDFSHSVHGAAASYIAGLLDLRGPSLSMTDFQIGFEHAVQLAQCWLDQKTCDRVLVGAVEELGQVLIDCAARMIPKEERISLGEGAVFLVLGPANERGVATIQATTEGTAPDFSFASRFGFSASMAAFEILGDLLGAGRTGNVDNATTFRRLFARQAGPRLVISR